MALVIASDPATIAGARPITVPLAAAVVVVSCGAGWLVAAAVATVGAVTLASNVEFALVVPRI